MLEKNEADLIVIKHEAPAYSCLETGIRRLRQDQEGYSDAVISESSTPTQHHHLQGRELGCGCLQYVCQRPTAHPLPISPPSQGQTATSRTFKDILVYHNFRVR